MKPVYRIILIIILGCPSLWPGYALGQTIHDTKIDIKADKKPLKEVFTIIQQKSGFQFIYNDQLVAAYTDISIKADGSTVAFILNEILSRTNLQYLEQNKKIIIAGKDNGSIALQNVGERTGILSGSVKDGSGMVIVGATIFLSKTRHITRTDEGGKFILNGLEPGKYEIAVKMLGFDPYVKDVFIQNSAVEINVILKENNITLNPVIIKGGPSNPFRQEYLTLFKEHFIGESFNSLECEIMNPEVLNLRYNKRKDVLEASSEAFITINNYSLGYRVNFLLTDFELDLKSNILIYMGAPYFEEMGGSLEQLEQWELNRMNTYNGSARHFFKALFNSSAEEEGFLLYPVPKKQVLKRLTRAYNERQVLQIAPVKTDAIFVTVNENIKEWHTNTPGQTNTGSAGRNSSSDANVFFVVYTKESEPMQFIVSGRHIPFPIDKRLSARSQISTIQPLLNKVTIDKNGSFAPNSFLFKGYWTWENVSDMLPLDYSPPPVTVANHQLTGSR
jgi:hypothetical protein